MNNSPGSRNVGIRADKQIGIDDAKFAACAKTDTTMIYGRAGGKIIVATEQARLIGCLQRSARGHRIRGGAVDRSIGDIIAREGNRFAVRPENHELVTKLAGHRVRSRKTVVLQAESVRKR